MAQRHTFQSVLGSTVDGDYTVYWPFFTVTAISTCILHEKHKYRKGEHLHLIFVEPQWEL